jgi:hypothetical protein
VADIAARIAQGIRTSANEVFVLDIVRRKGDRWVATSEALACGVEIECGIARPFLGGRDIKRFADLSPTKIVILPYAMVEGRARLLERSDLKNRFPLAWDYLSKNRAALEAREDGRMRGDSWFGYVYPKNLEVMLSPKILVPDIADRAQAAIDLKGELAFASGYGLTLKDESRVPPKLLLGLLNSRLLGFCIRDVSTPLRGGFFRYFTQFIEQLPIQRPKPAVSRDLVDLVETMLGLNHRVRIETMPQRREQLQRQIDATDRQIDQLVYELYGLTADEIRIVDGAT